MKKIKEIIKIFTLFIFTLGFVITGNFVLADENTPSTTPIPTIKTEKENIEEEKDSSTTIVTTKETKETEENIDTNINNKEDSLENIENENKNLEPTNEIDPLEVLKVRQEKIQETFEIPEVKKEEKKVSSELELLKIEKKNIELINKNITNELKNLRVQLEETNAIKKSLNKLQEENKNKSSELESLENKITSLNKEIKTKNLVLEKNKTDIESLSQEEALKEYALKQNILLQQKLQEKSNTESQKKYLIFSIVTFLFIVFYFIRLLIGKKYLKNRSNKKKYGHQFVVFDITIFLSYISFLVWFIFYIKPEIVIYLLFLVGAIVIILQEYIFSIISSIFIVQSYQVGSRIRFNGEEGIIEKITILKVIVRTIGSLGMDKQEIRHISNSQFMKNEVILLPKQNIENTEFKIVLPNDLSINLPIFVKNIEEILQKSITIKNINEITEKDTAYEIDFKFIKTGQPLIIIQWKETREKNNRIKRKILSELEKVKKTKIKESNDE